MTVRKRFKKFLYGRVPGLAGAFPYYGVKVHFPRGSVAFDEAVRQGVFEHDNVRFLLAFVRPGTTVFDVGGNLGLMAIPVLRQHATVKVVSFEPSPNTLPYLTKTVAGSAFRDRWTVEPKAAAEKVGELSFSASSSSNALFDGLRDTGRGGERRTVTVPVTTLDATWEQLLRPVVSMIKIDVEGAEMQVLAGAGGLLTASRPHILLEWNAQNLQAFGVDRGRLLEFAREHQYVVHSVPSGVAVDDGPTLDVQMVTTETFLLSPAQPMVRGG